MYCTAGVFELSIVRAKQVEAVIQVIHLQRTIFLFLGEIKVRISIFKSVFFIHNSYLQYFNMLSFYKLVLIYLQTFRSGGCNMRAKLWTDLETLHFFIILRNCYIFVALYMKLNNYEKGRFSYLCFISIEESI